MSGGARLAVDAGQTGVKLRFMPQRSAGVDDVRDGIRTDAPILPQLAAIVQEVQARGAEPIASVALGVSGLTGPDADARALRALLPGVDQVLLAHDSITSYLGALGDRYGAVVAAGTGAVTLGVGRTRVARIDGWGNIMGDAGSAYWIGREGLDAAMRAHDGRDAPTALVDAMRAYWPDVESAYIELQSAPDRVRQVAAFAEDVTALTSTDFAAARIAQRAADELAASVVTALRRTEDREGATGPDAAIEHVSAIGGVFRAERIRARFAEQVVLARPQVRLQESLGSGLDGAALLLELGPQHPLRTHLSEASSAD